MMRLVDIPPFQIGPGRPVLIIAEAGVNHDGDMDLARRLVSVARQAGANAVKFQTWRTEGLVARDAPLADYQRRNMGGGTSQFDMLKALELSQSDFRELKAYAEAQAILFLSTPDEEDSADFLIELGVPALKIGSGEVTNLPFLQHVAGLGRPLILSTGMSTLAEVEAAVDTIEAAGNQDLVLLHCVSNYPADAGDCNLRAMGTLAQAFGYPVGFSDHTVGLAVPAAAVALGAAVIEKHLTLDKSLPGPDHSSSLDPAEFAAMVKAIRSVERALGDGIKRPTADELATKTVVQKSWVAARSLSSGERLAAVDVVLRRGAPGLGPADLKWVIGRRLRSDLAAGAVINLDIFQ